MSFGLWRIENALVLSLELTVMTLECANQPHNVEQTGGQSKNLAICGFAQSKRRAFVVNYRNMMNWRRNVAGIFVRLNRFEPILVDL